MLPKIDFEKLLAFYVATKHRKFALAAIELGLSPSGISRQIQKLEEQLGYQLLERGGRTQFDLTEKGQILEKLAKKLFETVAEIPTALAETENIPEGPLKIAVHTGYSSQFLVQYIYEFLELYPKIQLTIIGSDSPLDMNLREADAIITPWISTAHSELICKPLLDLHLQLYASQSYIKKFGLPQSIEDLKNHRLVASVANQTLAMPTVNWQLYLNTQIPYQPYISSNYNTFIISAIEQGIGVGSLAQEFANEKENKLVRLFPDLKNPLLTIFFMYSPYLQNSKKLEIFHNFLKEKSMDFSEGFFKK